VLGRRRAEVALTVEHDDLSAPARWHARQMPSPIVSSGLRPRARLGHSSKYLLGVSTGRVAKPIRTRRRQRNFVLLALNNKNRMNRYKSSRRERLPRV